VKLNYQIKNKLKAQCFDGEKVIFLFKCLQ